MTVQGGTLNLGGQTVNVSGNVNLSNGTIDLDFGSLNVNGNVLQTGGTLNVDDGELIIGNNYTLQGYSTLIMTNDCDYILVNGNFTTNTSTDERGCLSNGILEVKGDFTQGGNSYAFAASGDNEVIFSGSNVQTVYFNNPQVSCFSNLYVTNNNQINYSVPKGYGIGDIINLIQGTAFATLFSILQKSVSEDTLKQIMSFTIKVGMIYQSIQNVDYFLEGLLMSADDNLFLGITVQISSLIGALPEDNYYYVFGRKCGDAFFEALYLLLAGYSAAEAGCSLGVSLGALATGGVLFITGVGAVACTAVAAEEAVQAGTFAALAAYATARVGSSESLLQKDSAKLAKLNQGVAEDGIVSKIGHNPALVKEAEKMGANQRVQQEADHLIQELARGNKNPGLGSKNLFKDIFYLRGRNGARVFYRVVDGKIEILAKASKENEQKVIDILTQMYNK